MQTLVGRYKVQGSVRFLSHQESFRAVQRALVRSEINLIYSQGYNPHPRLSLPLPKSVGLASEEELFCAQISAAADTTAEQNKELYKKISAQLPEGFVLVELIIHDERIAYKPLEAEYLIRFEDEKELEEIRTQADKLNSLVRAGEKITIERRLDEKGSVKTAEVGGFIKSVEQTGEGVKVVCKITDKGTIRPDETARLLGLKPESIGVSMSRKKIVWQTN
ncbi:MAG: TIGR03936 family radical SAM-associated protein [Phycisphaerae bacterium]|nr:TIGR03936 family radical SAM-associated protein [Phycisphaerae bacterium]